MAWKHGRSSKISFIGVFFSFICIVWCGAYGITTVSEAVGRYDREIKRSTRQLDDIKSELEKGRERLVALQLEEGNYLAQLEQIEKNIVASKTFLAAIENRIDTVESLLVLLDDSLMITEKRLTARQKLMHKRLRQAYMTGRFDLMTAIFTAKSPLDAINRVNYLEKVNQYDRDLAQRIAAGKKAISEKKAIQALELEHLSKLHSDKESENNELIAQQTQRKEMLSTIRKEKTSFEAMVKELESSQKELVSIIKLLEKKLKKARERISTQKLASFEKRKGQLPWPVDGSVVTKFGKVVHPEYQTVIMNNGIDIKAEKGEPVHCVSDGTVIHTGWLRGLGKMVIVDHVGGYLSIYAHLETVDVKTDQKVTADTILGKVGDTGSLSGAQMHFEIRKSSEALNPVDWLENR